MYFYNTPSLGWMSIAISMENACSLSIIKGLPARVEMNTFLKENRQMGE